MPRLSAIDAVNPAFERTKAMLGKPFRFKSWLKLGFIGWLGGGAVVAGGGFNVRAPIGPGQMPPEIWHRMPPQVHFQLAALLPLIGLIIAFGLAIALVFVYFFSRFAFILFDSVLSGDAAIGRGWNRYSRPAHRFFGYWLLYTVLVYAGLFFIVGLPIYRAYQRGVFQGTDALPQLLMLAASVVTGLLLYGLLVFVLATLARDFLIPVLALDGMNVGDSWSALRQYMAAEPAAFAGYLGMKLVLTIAVGIGMAIATAMAVIMGLIVLAIPGVALGIAAVLAMKSLGAAGVVLGVLIFCVLGAAALVVIFSAVFFCIAPVAVFMESYALYFFGGRYPKLGAMLWPQAPTAPQQSGVMAPAVTS